MSGERTEERARDVLVQALSGTFAFLEPNGALSAYLGILLAAKSTTEVERFWRRLPKNFQLMVVELRELKKLWQALEATGFRQHVVPEFIAGESHFGRHYRSLIADRLRPALGSDDNSRNWANVFTVEWLDCNQQYICAQLLDVPCEVYVRVHINQQQAAIIFNFPLYELTPQLVGRISEHGFRLWPTLDKELWLSVVRSAQPYLPLLKVYDDAGKCTRSLASFHGALTARDLTYIYQLWSNDGLLGLLKTEVKAALLPITTVGVSKWLPDE